MTTQGMKGAIITSPDLQQRGQKVDSALGWRDRADDFKATFHQCLCLCFNSSERATEEKNFHRSGSFPAVPVGSCCHVQRREHTLTGSMGSPSWARHQHMVGTSACGDLWSLLPSCPSAVQLLPLPRHKVAEGKGW